MAASLLYFDIRGRGECIRLLFKHAGVEFEDRRIQFSEWPEIKAAGVECPVRFLPVLTTPKGTKISQTMAIVQYVAEQHGLYGSNIEERGIINCVLASIKELFDEAADISVFTPEEEEKEKKRPKHDEHIKFFFTYFEKLRSENTDSNFLVGKTATVADILFIDLVDAIDGSMPSNKYSEQFPLLKKLNSDVRELENIKKYLAERK